MSQDSQPIELGSLFLPQWVEEIYYGGQWWKIEPGSLNDFESNYGDTTVYKDPFDETVVAITSPVTGYKFRMPKPEEPQASVTELKLKK